MGLRSKAWGVFEAVERVGRGKGGQGGVDGLSEALDG